MQKSSANEIKLYPSILRAFSFLVLGCVLIFTGISLIISKQELMYIIISFTAGCYSTLYGILNLIFSRKPVIVFDKNGFLYSYYNRPRLFVPKNLIESVSVRNTPNKRIIVTLKQINQDYKTYLKTIELPDNIKSCQQNTSKLRDNHIIIATENLNVNNAELINKITKYLYNNQPI